MIDCDLTSKNNPGIIFYDCNNKKIQLYLKKNTKEYYEDIINKDNNLDETLTNIINNISPLFKAYDFDNNHIILLLNKNKYDTIYDNIVKQENLEKISLEWFNNKNVHNNLKHKRLKSNDLTNTLNNILLNYKLR